LQGLKKVPKKEKEKGARHAIPPLSPCEPRHPAAIFIFSSNSTGAGWCSREVMDMGRSPWWVT
jgi:hypothetical protein